MSTRRDFLKTMSLASAGMMLGGGQWINAMTPGSTPEQKRASADKVKIAFIGIGNRGAQIIGDFERTQQIDVVALCDVDLDGRQCQEVLAKFPKAKRFRDFRKMFDEMGNKFEAVVVETPDFSHFPCVMLALNQGKHVYVEKPMGRTFYECELMIQAAKRNPHLVTQGGNQGHSEANYFQFKAWMDAGIIKDVTAVTAHMNNARRWHGWDSNIQKFPAGEQLPPDMDWDTWLCAAAHHDYHHDYHRHRDPR